MWTQFLNESRSQHKFHNKNLIILGGKHSGKRSLIDSLFDISKTTFSKRNNNQGNRMRLRGVTTAIDYAYLNVTDTADPDNRTHSKLEIYMVEEIDHPSVYSQLASTAFLRNSVFVVMLDFTAPWNFVAEVQRWVKFVYELQRMAGVSINDLEEMAKEVEDFYKDYREPQLDENGRLKTAFVFDRDANEEALPLPEGVLAQNIRIPLVICVNKCDLQSQVLREQSNTKILVILYHLRSLAVKYGAALVYTSIRNNCNLNVLYEYILHRAYRMPLRFKPEIANEEAIFIPLGFDNPTLIKDSVVRIDVERGFNDVVVAPISKKQAKEEILVEEDSKFFEKYINQAQSSTTNSEYTASQRESDRPAQRKKEEVTGFFLNLLQGGTAKRDTTIKSSVDQSQRLYNAEKDLLKHTAQVLQKRNLQQ